MEAERIAGIGITPSGTIEDSQMDDWKKWAEQLDADLRSIGAERVASEKRAEREREALKDYAPAKWAELQKAFADGCKALNDIPRLGGHRFAVRQSTSRKDEFVVSSQWISASIKVTFSNSRQITISGSNGFSYTFQAKLKVEEESFDELYFSDSEGRPTEAKEIAQAALNALLRYRPK